MQLFQLIDERDQEHDAKHLYINNSHYVYGFLAANIVTIIYIEALGIVLLITLLTLVYQLEKAARVNVASVVKTE